MRFDLAGFFAFKIDCAIFCDCVMFPASGAAGCGSDLGSTFSVAGSIESRKERVLLGLLMACFDSCSSNDAVEGVDFGSKAGSLLVNSKVGALASASAAVTAAAAAGASCRTG